MSATAWRIRAARTTDALVGTLPILVLITLALTSVFYAFVDRSRLLYTALAPAAFIGPAHLWARSMLGTRPADARPTVGQVLTGLQPARGGRARLLRAFAGIVALAAVLGTIGAAAAFTGALYASATVVAGTMMSGPAEVAQAAGELAANAEFQSAMERAKVQVVTALADEEYERIVAMTDEAMLGDVEAFIEESRSDAIIGYSNETSSVGYSGEIGEASFTLWEYVREADGSKARRRIIIDFQEGGGGTASAGEWRLVGLMRSTTTMPVEFVPDGTGVWKR